MNPDLGPYYLDYRLSKDISRREEQITLLRVKISMIQNSTKKGRFFWGGGGGGGMRLSDGDH